MSDFDYFPREHRKHVCRYANVESFAIDGCGVEHACVRVPRHYNKDGGIILCYIHLPKRENEKTLEKVCSRQHYEIIKLKERIAYLETLLPT